MYGGATYEIGGTVHRRTTRRQKVLLDSTLNKVLLHFKYLKLSTQNNAAVYRQMQTQPNSEIPSLINPTGPRSLSVQTLLFICLKGWLVCSVQIQAQIILLYELLKFYVMPKNNYPLQKLKFYG